MKLTAPSAPAKEFYTNYHKEKVLDPYFWLKEKQNPEVIAHLKKENEYFKKMLSPISGLTSKIFKELKDRLPKEDVAVPFRRGEAEFFHRYVKGKQYIQYCKKVGKKVSVLVDFNKMVKKDGYLSIHDMGVSYDGRYFAYSVDTKGDEVCDIVIISTDTKKVISHLKNTGGSFTWSNTDMIYYLTLDGHIRNDKVWRHILGDSQKKDQCIFHEPDQNFFIGCYASSSKKYLMIRSAEKVSSYVAYLPLDDKGSARPKVFSKLKNDVLYSLDHAHDGFYIRTNEKALNFKLLFCPDNKIDKKHWKVIIPHSKDINLLGMDNTSKFLCVYERSQGLPKARIINRETGKVYFIKFPEAAYNMSFSSDYYEYGDNKIRINYSSPITPKTTIEHDLVTKKQTVLKVDEVKKFHSKNYQVEYVMVPGHDKVKIPLCIIYKKGLKKNGQAPAMIYGYGSYGSTIGYNFSPSIVSLLDRGMVYAYAGIRGGTELGRKWYEDGKYLKKKNTFKDFISCSEYLVKKKYTRADRLAAKGASAGGLLMGAISNMRPDLYKVICAHVPFVDLINTMFDDSLPLTKTEYKEWGNPHDKKYYRYMKSYSPYDNVTEQVYPHMYITGGLNDQRVTYWEPTKWALKLRDFNSGTNDVLLKINMGEGHFGKSGRFDSLKEVAEEYSYVLTKLK